MRRRFCVFVVCGLLGQMWCLAWAVELQNDPSELSGPVFQVTADDPPGGQIAPSFTAFVEMYLKNQYSVL